MSYVRAIIYAVVFHQNDCYMMLSATVSDRYVTCSNNKYVWSNSESVQCNFFIFWSRDVHPVQNLLLCTKFHENPIIFPWDMAIYQFSKWRPSAILELFYHHTRPPTKFLLLAAAACQISYQSDTQLWRYSYLNFSNIWLQMPIQAPKMGVLGDFGPLNVIIHHRDPQKAHSCVNPRLSYQL